MKYLTSTLTGSLLEEPEMRRNVGVVLRYVGFLVLVVVIYSVAFHFIMWNVEGEQHSWITGLYWTLTVMSTLGFGDVTFQSDIGRLFSVIVLVSGIVLLLVLLPFVFIRYFYAPWLEAQVRRRAPRELPESTSGHVLITDFDPMAEGLAHRLELMEIPHFILEPDPEKASRMHDDGLPAVTGDPEDRLTWERVRARQARLVLANGEDTRNANVVLTAHEVAPDLRVAAVANVEDSVDILELTGAQVLPLKRRLGEQLANRVNVGHAGAHVIGSFRDLLIAEFTVHDTPLAGKTIRESQLRDALGLNVVGVWEEAVLRPADPDYRLSESSVPVVVGTENQIRELDELLAIYDVTPNPVVVIGGGKVGRSATRALKSRGAKVHMIEKNPGLRDRIGDLPDRLFIGDAAHRELLAEAGLEDAPSVLLTTNDDAVNIYLAVYCRRLNPDVRLVSRITSERNMEAVRRAGVDLALSFAALGVETVQALLQGRELIFLGAGIELYQIPVPASLEEKTLAESDIRARTGLNVIALETPDGKVVNPGSESRMPAGSTLLMLGESGRLETFKEAYE